MRDCLTWQEQKNNNDNNDILNMPNVNYSRVSFEKFNISRRSKDISRLKIKLKAIFENKEYTEEQKSKLIFNIISSSQYGHEDIQMVYNSLDNNIKEFINRLPNNINPVKPRFNNPAFSFNEKDEGKERNIVFLKDNTISDSSGGHHPISSLIEDYNEDVDKPPVFETHVNTSALNRFFMKAEANHAFIGFRFTQYKDGKYKRKHFKIGYGLDEDREERNIGFGIKIKSSFFVPNKLVDDMNTTSAVSTQTEISVDQSKRLLNNIELYFKKYPLFSLIGRNCNVFTRTMAREIGLGNIAKLHNTISPSSAANRISKELSKGRNLDRLRSDFSTDKFKYGVKVGYEVSSNEFSGEFRNLMGKTTGWEEKERKPFMKTATDIARQDLSRFDKSNTSKNFRSREAEKAVQGISNSIIALNYMIEKGFPESFVRSYCESIKKNIHRAISITGKKHLNLNVYLMRVYNLIDYTGFKYRSPNSQGNISENENIE